MKIYHKQIPIVNAVFIFCWRIFFVFQIHAAEWNATATAPHSTSRVFLHSYFFFYCIYSLFVCFGFHRLECKAQFIGFTIKQFHLKRVRKWFRFGKSSAKIARFVNFHWIRYCNANRCNQFVSLTLSSVLHCFVYEPWKNRYRTIILFKYLKWSKKNYLNTIQNIVLNTYETISKLNDIFQCREGKQRKFH